MARNKGGAWNRLLNFIGLVDDGDSRDTYGEEYENGNYGRQAAYTPARSSRQSASTARNSRQNQRRSLPEPRTSRFDDRSDAYGDSFDGQDAAGYDDYSESRYRASSRFDDGSRDSYTPARQTRAASRFSEPQERRQSNAAPQQQQSRPQQSRSRAPQRSRTVMYSLHTLEDCCEVIDQLIANNTVVLTMDELDGRLLQRAVDTLSGAVFALHASIRKASDKTYLVAPQSVEVNDAYDVERGFR